MRVDTRLEIKEHSLRLWQGAIKKWIHLRRLFDGQIKFSHKLQIEREFTKCCKSLNRQIIFTENYLKVSSCKSLKLILHTQTIKITIHNHF